MEDSECCICWGTRLTAEARVESCEAHLTNHTQSTHTLPLEPRRRLRSQPSCACWSSWSQRRRKTGKQPPPSTVTEFYGTMPAPLLHLGLLGSIVSLLLPPESLRPARFPPVLFIGVAATPPHRLLRPPRRLVVIHACSFLREVPSWKRRPHLSPRSSRPPWKTSPCAVRSESEQFQGQNSFDSADEQRLTRSERYSSQTTHRETIMIVFV